MAQPPASDSSSGFSDWPAFEALVRDQYGRLCSCAYRYVRSPAAAEDVVHEVLLRAWVQRERLADVDLLAYLLQSVRNGAISALRKVRTEGARDERLAGELASRDNAPADEAGHDELVRAVTAAIEQLPERCRLIFLLHRDGGLTYREIAERLDLSIKTVETQMGRALRALRQRLGPLLSVSLTVLGSGVAKRLLG